MKNICLGVCNEDIEVKERGISLMMIQSSTITSIAFSFSSVTSNAVLYEDINMLMNNLFARTSNFFTSSPWIFVLPAIPYLAVKSHIKEDSTYFLSSIFFSTYR